MHFCTHCHLTDKCSDGIVDTDADNQHHQADEQLVYGLVVHLLIEFTTNDTAADAACR